MTHVVKDCAALEDYAKSQGVCGYVVASQYSAQCDDWAYTLYESGLAIELGRGYRAALGLRDYLALRAAWHADYMTKERVTWHL